MTVSPCLHADGVIALVRLPRADGLLAVCDRLGVAVTQCGTRYGFYDVLNRWPWFEVHSEREARLTAARRWPSARWRLVRRSFDVMAELRAAARFYDAAGLIS